MRSIFNWIDLPYLGDERGSMVAVEVHESIPFEIKRIYYIFNTASGAARGFHAHKNLQQVAVCLAGRCKMILDDGVRREEAWLDSPTKGLMIGSNVWREMHEFSSDCVLLVIASDIYDEADYVRDYASFRSANA